MLSTPLFAAFFSVKFYLTCKINTYYFLAVHSYTRADDVELIYNVQKRQDRKRIWASSLSKFVTLFTVRGRCGQRMVYTFRPVHDLYLGGQWGGA